MAEGAGTEAPRLPELLAAGWRLWEEVEAGTEPSSAAPAVQDKVRRGLDALQQAAAMVAQYKQKKELENRLASMRTFVESGQADEDQMREFYLLQTQKWINISLEEIESIDQETVILRSRAPPHGTSRQVRAPLKPFILTRDAAQAKVFGAGYPGVPTMTVDDWYEQRRRQGVMPGQTGVTDDELQKKQQEKKEEEDDEEALQKARNWDDWKDTHPKGYGNRQNMG
uniref:IGBP1 protein n=1 Tax=Apteryx owenii TaxID=8824 RepID=A0A8B9S9C3_APTOW